ncbi:MAG: hypothetical protein GY791_17740 [Alphaproteobacteria bacterium]|nr:hypothetical protein [Alphaproteobacteria bacterium]
MTGFVTTYQGYVMPAQCDGLGHFNVQYYFAAISDAMFGFQTRLGLAPSVTRDQGLSFAVVHSDAAFKAELVTGDVYRLDTAILRIGGKSATFLHRFVRVEDEVLAMESRFTAVLFDTRLRRAVTIPDEIRRAAEPFLISENDTPE